MSHTPGPWHRGGRDGAIVYDSSPDGWAVANAVTYHGRASDEDRANAELIASAPDLLNALRELTLRTRQFIAGDLVSFPVALLPQCEAIISKATGR